MDSIIIRGASEHNLKHVDLEIPRNRLVVVTGVSGSGKSSLAFDTLYAEGQRRYVESLSAYARQFLDRLQKPRVDSIEGLSPAISIEQKNVLANPRSTVGTITEIYDHLRLLFARVGTPHCPECDRPITSQTVRQMTDRILALPQGSRVQMLAPVVRGRKGEYNAEIRRFLRLGFVRARIDGTILELEPEIRLDKRRKHDLEVLVDRLVVKEGIGQRLADSLEVALQLADGLALSLVREPGGGEEEVLFSERLACISCGVSIPEMSPRAFSFNSPYGACPSCDGLGVVRELDPGRLVPEPDLSLAGGALAPWKSNPESWMGQMLKVVLEADGQEMTTPWRRLPRKVRQAVLEGSGEREYDFRYVSRVKRARYSVTRPFEGVMPWLQRRYHETSSNRVRTEIENWMSEHTCGGCEGARLRPESLAVRIGDWNIADLCRLDVDRALKALEALDLEGPKREVADRILKELRERLGFLANVGVGYLELERRAGTLAGGEGQRIRLATQIGSRLTGVLYVLDEPSVGLHSRDNRRLLQTLEGMRDLGNSVVVVEHDEETIRTADWIVDMGPGAGVRGGEVVAAGPMKQILRSPASLTAAYLRGEKWIPIPGRRRPSGGPALVVRKACEHNLKSIDARFPLGCFVAVTGVSGSGKSTLVNDILYRALARRLHGASGEPGAHGGISGVGLLDKVVAITQAPIGRTPRSNPATYTGAFTTIRTLFSRVPEARARGYTPGRFSFNVKGGRCEECQGGGSLKIEMHFLPDVYVTCSVCAGRRYNRETLDVRYRGRTIAGVLEMTVDEALEVFENVPDLARTLGTLSAVGLGYLHLGQSATTLSGGEAQRVKLSRHLARRATGKTVLLLDEPTTGLHFEDVRRLLGVLQDLVDAGNTVIVIEHHLDVVKNADYIIDLGPEGGAEGGEIVVTGSPEEVADCRASWTGRYLRQVLRQARAS